MEIPHLTSNGMAANDKILTSQSDDEVRSDTDPLPVLLHLRIDCNGQFTLTYYMSALHAPSVSGKLKPLPRISDADVALIDNMIQEKCIPYPTVPETPGKTSAEIEALGWRLFPFTPYSFHLAMCLYDWTTASFTRMVFFKIFQYTGISEEPFPVDIDSIAMQIWNSNWGSYNPKNPDYMNSFMMEPADSLADVNAQLSRTATKLHSFSDAENRLLSAAMQALPPTSVFQHPQLFSGQMDIYQLGLDHFGIEFLECPLNEGPVGRELATAFADALRSYISAGKTIITKMAWSFTDDAKDAMHYSNGILLVANTAKDSLIWKQASYVTPLSDDPKKTEYVFAPGTQFEVHSIEYATVLDKKIVVITLVEPSDGSSTTSAEVQQVLPGVHSTYKVLELIQSNRSTRGIPHTEYKTGGRRCACFNRV
ncbi:hypothetical protein B0I35DRAFT_48667 [Stachybotrys elegans]|uniref:Uncharacterized protein n=1 Tax=Stachybotrys elegans TaxID=80388 RepID=A0A8K0WXY4_9HYPO|nr:hypothetical protein B0I35DRAFT_48667 [Stachybotrys elegans]